MPIFTLERGLVPRRELLPEIILPKKLICITGQPLFSKHLPAFLWMNGLPPMYPKPLPLFLAQDVIEAFNCWLPWVSYFYGVPMHKNQILFFFHLSILCQRILKSTRNIFLPQHYLTYVFTCSLCFLYTPQKIKAWGGQGFLCCVLAILSPWSSNMMQVLTRYLVNDLLNERIANGKLVPDFCLRKPRWKEKKEAPFTLSVFHIEGYDSDSLRSFYSSKNLQVRVFQMFMNKEITTCLKHRLLCHVPRESASVSL